jgi:enoyl-CoA hydratase/carnithine racemase
VALGFHPGFAISHTLPRDRGSARRLDDAVGRAGQRCPGARLGLVDRLVEADDLDTAAQAMAREMAANGPLALVAVRGTMVRGLADAVAAALDRELAEQAILRETADYAEGSPLCSSGARRVSPGADRQVYIGIKYIK